MGNAHVRKNEAQDELRRGREEANIKKMPIKEFEGEPSEELRMRKAHGTSDDGTENSGSKSPGTRLREGLAIRDMYVGNEEETESARAEGEALSGLSKWCRRS